MKRISLVLNIVLAVAVIVLYVLYFTGAGKKNISNEAGSPMGVSGSENIYYVQIDSVITNYDMAKDLTGKLETKLSSSDATLKSRQDAYQKEVNDYQYKVQRGLVTRADAQNIEQRLLAKQQDLVRLQQNLGEELNEEQLVMNRQVIDAIMQYMKENSAKYNYKYVLATSFGSGILYANDSLDITDSVVAGLNEKYNKEKQAK